MSWGIRQGDCLEVLATLEPDSIDAVVVDPPYGLEFMGNGWDAPWKSDGFRRSQNPADVSRESVFGRTSARGPEYKAGIGFQEWTTAWASELLRVLKPGGHLLAFGGTRTYHRLTAGIEDAGFEIRDCLAWMFGTGFPKSKNLDGDREGWGTALKPAFEPIVMARKPLIGTVAANVGEHGTGALNIDGCRIGSTKEVPASPSQTDSEITYGEFGTGEGRIGTGFDAETGRWPANVILDPEAGEILDEQTGTLSSGILKAGTQRQGMGYMGADGGETERDFGGDSGGPSRFFYCAKASRAERNAGLDGFEDRPGGMRSENSGQHITRRAGDDPAPTKNHHPTVKPIDLMRWCVRLVTPPGGTVLDCFNGSGTTGIAAVLEGFNYLGIEREAEYIDIASARIAWWEPHQGDTAVILARAGLAEKERRRHEERGQLGLLEGVA